MRVEHSQEGISAFIRETPKSSFALFLSCEDTTRSQQSATEKGSQLKADPMGMPISDFQLPEWGEIDFCCL